MIRQNIAFATKDFFDIQKATYMELKWYVKDYERVHAGTPIVRLTLFGYNMPQSHVINSDFEGICRILNPDTTIIRFPEDELAFIVDNEMDYIYPYKLDKHADSFTNETIINWKQISGLETTVGVPMAVKNTDALYISNCFKNSKMFLVFNFYTKYVKLKKGDTISLKFSNGDILDFTLESKPAKNANGVILPEDNENYCTYLKDEDYLGGFLSCTPRIIGKKKASIRKNEFALSHKDLSLFLSETLSMVRISFNSEGGTFIDIDIQSCIMDKKVCPMIIKSLFIILAEEISKFDSSYSSEKLKTIEDIKDTAVSNTVEKDPCFVYLMHDEANGFYKIGMSNNPVYREGTLQSEKPTIKLIASHRYPTRKFASALETALHNLYSNLHIRGEWYRLSEDDVSDIIEGLK